MDRCILLIDADAFFVSVARQVDPDGAGRSDLLIVGGEPGGRGVVASASYGARRWGVRAGMSTDRALERCPLARVVPVPGEDCRRVSRRIGEVLSDLAPVVERASVDEWYLDATGLPGLTSTRGRRAFAHSLRSAVLGATGIGTSTGVGTNRLVAKVAAGLGKPGGVHVVPPGHEGAFMRRFDLREIPGVGPKFAAELGRRGLVRVEDALPLAQDVLDAWLGPSRGPWLYRRVRGIDDTPVHPGRSGPRSVSREQTFDRDLRTDEDCRSNLADLATDAASALRKSGCRARTVGVKVRDYAFRERSASRTLAAPVESDRVVRQVALELLDSIRAQHRAPVRLLGVALGGLAVPGAEGEQIPLFEDAPIDTDRDRALARWCDRPRGE